MNTEETSTEQAATEEGEAPTAAAPATAAAAPAARKAPIEGEDGYTKGDKPEQVHEGERTPEQLLAEKRGAPKRDVKMAHEDLALRLGMLPAIIDQPTISLKRRVLVPGRMNPKYGDYNLVRGKWPARHEVTQEELEAAIAEAKGHVFRGHNKRGAARAKRQGQ